MCSGKYNDIYFYMKITYPLSTLPEHIHSTICTISTDGGMCYKPKLDKLRGNRDTNSILTHLWGLMPEPRPRRSIAIP